MGISKRAWQVAGAAAGGASLFGGGLAIGRLLRLDSQRGDYRKAWENHNLATLDRLRELDEHPEGERPYLIVSLGDSSVQGVGASRVTESYPARLASSIAAQMDREVLLLNLSLSGATIESVELTQIPQMRGLGLLDGPYSPDLVTLTIGGNDVMTEDMAPGQFEERLRRVLAALPANALVSTIPSFGIMPQESRAQDMSDRIAAAVSDSDANVVDLRSLTQEYSLPTYTFAYHAADFFHPNSRPTPSGHSSSQTRGPRLDVRQPPSSRTPPSGTCSRRGWHNRSMTTDGPWLVVGLGNPGAQYASTRHNVGYLTLDVLASRGGATLTSHRSRTHTADVRLGIGPGGVPGPRVILARSDSYMNTSGGPISALATFHKIEPSRILVIHDDMDLPAHTLRLKVGGGEGGHNGLKSLSQHLGTRDYARLRIGVGRPPGRMDPADYVLAPLPSKERPDWDVTFAQAADVVEDIVTKGFAPTQMALHTGS